MNPISIFIRDDFDEYPNLINVISSCCKAIVYEGDICSKCFKKCDVENIMPVTNAKPEQKK